MTNIRYAPGKCTVLGGGKCPNLGVVNVRILGVVNVRILGVVNVRLANDLPPSKIVQIEQTIKKTRKTPLLQPSKDKNTKKEIISNSFSNIPHWYLVQVGIHILRSNPRTLNLIP